MRGTLHAGVLHAAAGLRPPGGVAHRLYRLGVRLRATRRCLSSPWTSRCIEDCRLFWSPPSTSSPHCRGSASPVRCSAAPTATTRAGFYGAAEPRHGNRLSRPLPPPDLIIRDELHLVSGPLGTMAGLYEAAIEALCVREIDGRKVKAQDSRVHGDGSPRSGTDPGALRAPGDTHRREPAARVSRLRRGVGHPVRQQGSPMSRLEGRARSLERTTTPSVSLQTGFDDDSTNTGRAAKKNERAHLSLRGTA